MDMFAASMNIILEGHRRAALRIVNKAEFENGILPNSSVQIGHKLTGIAVDCAAERLEQKNKVKAMKALRSHLLPQQEEEDRVQYAQMLVGKPYSCNMS
jgi:hypothetical protein